MALKLGTGTPSRLYKGTTEINRAYLGTNLVWNNWDFEIQIQVAAPKLTFELGYDSGGTYTGTIYWGDGNTSTNSFANKQHTYATGGTYNIKVAGQISDVNFDDYGSGVYKLIAFGKETFNAIRFQNCVNLSTSDLKDTLKISGTSLNNLFRDCTSITTIPFINDWDVSSVTSMRHTFNGVTSFNDSLSNWDVSNVTDFRYCFAYTSSYNTSLNAWNTSSATDMRVMFAFSAYNQSLSNFDTSNVTLMTSMFQSNTAFNQELDWDFSSITDMSNFMAGKSAANYDATKYDTILENCYNGGQENVTLNMGSVEYTSAGSSYRNDLRSFFGAGRRWTITDGGQQ
jgi:surface protein